MWQQTVSPEDFEKRVTVFDGSSPEDVSHARQLWSSLSLLPPLESRLESADIRQRLPVSRPQRGGTPAVPGPRASVQDPPDVSVLRRRQEERRRYEAMADQRKEILALLRRQREQRIQKELLSAAGRPPGKTSRDQILKPDETSDCEKEKELVRELQ